MKRMRKLSNGRDRGETRAALPEDGPAAGAKTDDGEGKFAAFGMRKDRDDMADVNAWVRNLRRGRFDAF